VPVVVVTWTDARHGFHELCVRGAERRDSGSDPMRRSRLRSAEQMRIIRHGGEMCDLTEDCGWEALVQWKMPMRRQLWRLSGGIGGTGLVLIACR